MATDIAFVVGALALLGPRVPVGLKLFPLTLAIVDGLGVIAVIALFYSDGIDLAWMAGAAAALLLVAVLRPHVRWPVAYVPLALVAWICTLESGVHATVAGVALGLLTPARPSTDAWCWRTSSMPCTRGAASWWSRCSRSPTSASSWDRVSSARR